MPLRSVETKFAIDSSGFGTSRYERWYDQKYGITRTRCLWLKCHNQTRRLFSGQHQGRSAPKKCSIGHTRRAGVTGLSTYSVWRQFMGRYQPKSVISGLR
jgi:hypothetical protein